MEMDWFVLRTHSRQEKVVEDRLALMQIPCYLPRKTEIRQWHDRKKRLRVPLFPGYVFVQPEAGRYHELNSIRGSCGLVTFNHRPAPIQPRELSRIRIVTDCGKGLQVHPHLLVGEKVVILSGPLKGLEGELIRIKNGHRLVINAHILGQSVSLEIGIEEVEKPRPA